MIKWVDHRLKSWAIWVANSRAIEGLSYPKSCVAPKTGGGGASKDVVMATAPRLNEAGAQTHRAVQALRRDAVGRGDELFDAVLAYYIGQGDVVERAKTAGISRSTLHARVCRAQQWISEWIEVENIVGKRAQYVLTRSDEICNFPANWS